MNNWCLFVCNCSFSCFPYSSCSAISSSYWQHWGIKVVITVVVFTWKVIPFSNTKYSSFSWQDVKVSTNLWWDFLSVYDIIMQLFQELEQWQNMNHSCNNSCACVHLELCKGMCALHTHACLCLNNCDNDLWWELWLFYTFHLLMTIHGEKDSFLDMVLNSLTRISILCKCRWPLRQLLTMFS